MSDDRNEFAPSAPRPAGIEIRLARASEAAALSELAARTFYDAFGEQNTAENLAAHIALTFGTERITREIEDSDSVILLALDSRERRPVGYAKLRLRSAHEAVRGGAPIELERLYVDSNLHRSGVGSALLNTCLETARNNRCDTMWLGVWEHNHKAIAFYHRWGFKQIATHVFRLGSDDQTDLVLARELRSDPGIE